MALSACATDADLGPNQEPPFCIDLRGAGQTDGSLNALRGHGDFMFGSDSRTAFVALYIFDRRDGENGGQYADVNYQFVWDGESFLTADHIYLEPVLNEDTFHFNVAMTIVAGTGRFAGMVGDHPVSIDATLTVTPPAEPGDRPTAHEEFTVVGKLCGDQWR